jgi:drug/metabolite transporter (DMT)-like permease
MLLFFVLGVFSFCIPFSLLYWAEETIPSGLASVLFAVYPFIVAVVSHFVLPDEPMTATKIMGIASAFIGVLVIFWADLSLGGVSMLGMLAVLVCTLLQGSILVYVKKKGHHIPAVSLNVGGMIFGVPVMYLLAFIFDDFSKVHLDARGIFSFCYLGAFGTVVAFVIYYWLLKRVEAVFVSLVTFVTPVFAIILGALILGEKLGPRDLLGALLVLLGILISNSRDIVKAIQAKHAQTFAVAQKEQL